MDLVKSTITELNNGQYNNTDEKYKYSVGIATQNITHKQKFQGLTRKNSLSIWSKMIPDYVADYKTKRDALLSESDKSAEFSESDTQYEVEVNPVVTAGIISQLKSDFINMQKGESISDLGIILVRARKTSNPAHLFSYYIAMHYFQPKDNTPEQELNSRMRFNGFLSKVSAYYRKRELEEFNKKTMFRQSRNNGNKNMWCSLKTRPISDRIINPTAMKVDVAPLEELKPFFDYLKSNKPIEPNFFDKDRKNMCHKFARGALYEDKRLDLCKQVVGPDHIQELMDSLAHSDLVEHFLLGNNVIGTQGAIAIAEYIKFKHNIKTWYLAGNDLDKDGIKYICYALADDSVCTDLWLKRNPIGPQGAVHVKYLLEHNKTIDTLDLHNTGLLDDGCKEIFEGLKSNTSVKLLYMDSNGFTPTSAKYIADYFDYLVANDIYGIDSIWMDINRFEDDGIIEIVKSMGKYRHLKRLAIGSNGFTEKAMAQIYESFKKHPNLKVLDLGMYKSTSDLHELTNRTGNEGSDYISKLLEANKVLEYLAISHNGIEIEGMTKIIDAFQNNNSLIQFEIQQYGLVLGQELVKKFKTKLGENRMKKEIKNINNYVRFLKHGSKITAIDSIYRNNSK